MIIRMQAVDVVNMTTDTSNKSLNTKYLYHNGNGPIRILRILKICLNVAVIHKISQIQVCNND